MLSVYTPSHLLHAALCIRHAWRRQTRVTGNILQRTCRSATLPLHTHRRCLTIDGSIRHKSTSSNHQYTENANIREQQIPYPFMNMEDYEAFLDSLESRSGHRFQSPNIVLGLMFHCSDHEYLQFLGSGLLRFYASHMAYERFKHYDEGYMTRLKDFLHSGLNVQDMALSASMGLDLTEAVNAVQTAQAKWIHPKRPKPPNQPIEYATNRTDFSAPMTASAARAEFNRLVSSSFTTRSSQFLPQASWPSDLLQPALAAVFLDGGWEACDRLANRTVGRQLISLQHLLRHELPDETLGSENWKSVLQPLVQRLYGVTPVFEVLRQEGNKFTIRVAIPPITVFHRSDATSMGASTSYDQRNSYMTGHESAHLLSPDVPPALTAMHASVHVMRSSTIYFDPFSGTKKIAEQRAAKCALEKIRSERRGLAIIPTRGAEITKNPDDATLGLVAAVVDLSPSEAQTEKHIPPADLRAELHDLAAAVAAVRKSQEAKEDAEPLAEDFIHPLFPRATRLLVSLLHPGAKSVVTPVSSISTVTSQFKSHGEDLTWCPFERLRMEAQAIETESSKTQSPQHGASISTSHVQFTDADYTLLLEVLTSIQGWSLFPSLWLLISDVGLLLTRTQTNLLIDGFARARTLPLVIQTLRKVRHQQRWRVGPDLIVRLLLACARANPLWGWQQTEKLMAEMMVEGRQQEDKNRRIDRAPTDSMELLSPAIGSTVCVPSILHFNSALWCCLRGYSTLVSQLLVDPSSGGLISPPVILKAADRIRAQMKTFLISHKSTKDPNHQIDVHTVAICAILDAYANRLSSGWTFVRELEHRIGLSPSPERLEWMSRQSSVTLDGDDESHTDIFDLLQPTRIDFERRRVIEYAEEAKPVIDATMRIMRIKHEEDQRGKEEIMREARLEGY